jgi:23S rRNA pseudouridine2605 synthase
MPEERLQKIMAHAGVGSRRACEQMILDGRVQVGGHTVTELGTKADADLEQITVDGRPLRFRDRYAYVKVHKPRGVLSDVGGDTRGRRTVGELVSDSNRRLYPVGRLDLNSEGLVLMTDDGELAHRLTHPRFEHEKTYYVLIPERPTEEALSALRSGVDLQTGKTAPAHVSIVSGLPASIKLAPGPTKGVWLEIKLHEGKKRQIRHMTAQVGYPTLRLVRWSIGSLELGSLPSGQTTHLTRKEVSQLRQEALVEQSSKETSGGRPPKGKRTQYRSQRPRQTQRRIQKSNDDAGPK